MLSRILNKRILIPKCNISISLQLYNKNIINTELLQLDKHIIQNINKINLSNTMLEYHMETSQYINLCNNAYTKIYKKYIFNDYNILNKYRAYSRGNMYKQQNILKTNLNINECYISNIPFNNIDYVKNKTSYLEEFNSSHLTTNITQDLKFIKKMENIIISNKMNEYREKYYNDNIDIKDWIDFYTIWKTDFIYLNYLLWYKYMECYKHHYELNKLLDFLRGSITNYPFILDKGYRKIVFDELERCVF